jgi:hypothetical protein
MKNILLIILPVCLGILFVHEAFVFVNRERTDWVEGNFVVSPAKNRAVYFQTASNEDSAKSFCRISVFDARQYPDIVNRSHPTRYQMNNPTASYLLPLQLYARVATLEFDSGSSRVMIKQGPVNRQPPIAYEIDLDGHGLRSLNQDTEKKPVTGNLTFKALCKYWISESKIIRGKKDAFKNYYTLKLKPDSTVETYFKPDNFHKGKWLLQGDSSFVLYLKMAEEFKIMGLTDSTLIVGTKWDDQDVIIEFRAH